MTHQNTGGGELSAGELTPTVNPSYESESENKGEVTVFGPDGPVTISNIITEIPPRGHTGPMVTYRLQKDRYKTAGENGDAFTDINDEDSIASDRFQEIRSKSARMASISLRRASRARRATAWNIPTRRPTAWSIDYDEEDAQRELILKTRKNLPLKDFTEEIRAQKDLAKFLVQPVVLLDLMDRCLESIIEKLVGKLMDDLETDERITHREGATLFTNCQPGVESYASIDQLRETIQGVKYTSKGTIYENTWITALCSLPSLKKSHVAIARLRHPLNLGNKCEEISFVIAIVAPKKQKFTKTAVEVGRTFSTLMSNICFRKQLMDAPSEDEFKRVIKEQNEVYVEEVRKSLSSDLYEEEEIFEELQDFPFYHFGRGMVEDVKRRLPFYWSDLKDGFTGKDTIRKVISTILFLYFACLLPDIAFGTVYEDITKGKLDVTACIISQTFGGLIFSLLSGQPLLVLVTTAPLVLYVKVIYLFAEVVKVDFLAMYAMVGLWNSFFIILQGCLHASKLMKFSTRSTEEIFSFFIALAFIADAVNATIENDELNYHFDEEGVYANRTSNETLPDNCISDHHCFRPENFVLFLFLMMGTLGLGLLILRFEQSQFLSATKREMIAAYALPISVIFFAFIGSYVFRAIQLTPFEINPEKVRTAIAPFSKLRLDAIFIAAGLGLSLSCLFFVEQNVSAVLVNSPANKLQKGPAYHWDLVLIGVINGVLSIFNLPWLHAALPHSPLHVRALADVEQQVTTLGAVHDEIVKVRETRITTFFSHILIGTSLFYIEFLQNIPVPVLLGLFLYLGFTSFKGNQMFDRMLLIFTEGSSYPPNHYVRRVPQRKIHTFTFCQVVQLIIVCVFGFAKQYYLKMIFPIFVLLLLPIRHKLMTRIIEPKYLAILDSDLS